MCPAAEPRGSTVQVLPRAQRDPQARLTLLRQQLAESCTLEARLRLPGAVGDIVILSDPKAEQNGAEVTVPAPEDRKGAGRSRG